MVSHMSLTNEDLEASHASVSRRNVGGGSTNGGAPTAAGAGDAASSAPPKGRTTWLRQLEGSSTLVAGAMRAVRRWRKRGQAFKKGFFDSLVALLVEGDNAYYTFAVIFIEFLQSLAFCFMEIEWGEYGNQMGKWLRYTQVEEAVVQYTAGTTIYYMVLASVILIAIMVGLAFYVVKSFVNSDFQMGVWPLRALRTLVSMLASIFFLPITYSLFSAFTCNNFQDCDGNPIMMTIRVLSALALPCFLPFTFLMSLTYFHPNPKSKAVAARPTARLELLELGTKTLLTIFFVFGGHVPVLRAVVTFLCSMSISVYMAKVDPSVHNYVFYGYLGGAPCVLAGAILLYSRYQNWVTSYDIALGNFKPKGEENYNTWEVEEVGGDADEAKETRFWHPSQVEIATRFLISNSSPEAMEVADRMFLFGIQKFPKSASLMVQFYKNDASMASNYLKKAKAHKPIIDLEFSIYQQEQEMRSVAGRTVGNKKLDAVDRVEFRQLMKNATTYHKEAKASIATFWQTIMMAEDDVPVDTNTLVNLVSQMEKSDKSAVGAYRQLMSRFPLSVRMLRRYAEFLDEIHNNRDEADSVRKRIKKIQEAGMSDELISATAGAEAKLGPLMRTRKEKKAYKEYRKQVYLYSKANSAQLVWMIRGVQLILLIIALAQLLVMVIGVGFVRTELGWLHMANSCRGAFPEVHSNLRTLQSLVLTAPAGPLPPSIGAAVNSTFSAVLSDLSLLSSNSSSLIHSTAVHTSIYNLWGSPWLELDVFYGAGVSPNRSAATATLMDATMNYVRHATAAVEDIVGAANSTEASLLDFYNLDWRFILDNGVVLIADGYMQLTFVLANRIYMDIWMVLIAQIVVWGVSFLALLAIGAGIFLPVITKAKLERETSLRAFLQIPKSVTQTLFRKYYEPSAGSTEDLSGPGKGSKDEDLNASQNLEAEEEDEDFKGKKDKDSDFLQTRNTTNYYRLTTLYIRALTLLAFVYTIAAGANLVKFPSVITLPGTLVSGMDLHQRTVRIGTVIRDALITPSTSPSQSSNLSGPVSAFVQMEPARPWASYQTVLGNDVDAIRCDQVSILYGNTSLGLPLAPLASSYNSILFETNNSASDPPTLYETVATFTEETIRLSLSSPLLKQADDRASRSTIVTGYDAFLAQFENQADSDLTTQVNVSIGMLVLVAVTVAAVYFLYWRQILSYLIKTENERTLKLLLMIPVEIVADIDSLRELLHLKRSSAKGRLHDQLTSSPSGVINVAATNQGNNLYVNPRKGSAKSRQPSLITSINGGPDNVLHTRVMADTPDGSPLNPFSPGGEAGFPGMNFRLAGRGSRPTSVALTNFDASTLFPPRVFGAGDYAHDNGLPGGGSPLASHSQQQSHLLMPGETHSSMVKSASSTSTHEGAVAEEREYLKLAQLISHSQAHQRRRSSIGSQLGIIQSQHQLATFEIDGQEAPPVPPLPMKLRGGHLDTDPASCSKNFD
ncbi:hypothetical protein HK101_008494 [Irineochytrium annulatum]|nr:hypothetical protein HK101_008494 [Irineochytrium annulatum]